MKQRLLAIMRRLGAFGLLRGLQRRRPLILAYHGVLAGNGRDEPYLNYNFVSAAAFERQLQFLTTRYRPVALESLVASVAAGRPVANRSVTVTFDDGFRNNYDVAFPLLKKYRVPATIFVTTGMIGRPDAMLWTERVSRAVYLTSRPVVRLSVGGAAGEWPLSSSEEREQASRAILALLKRTPPAARDLAVLDIEGQCGRPAVAPSERERYDFLSWEQIAEMAGAGVEFGSHTVTHPIVSTLSDVQLRQELVESKAAVEAAIGRPCVTFAYPNGGPGDFGPREQAALRMAGYRCGLALGGRLVASSADPFAWPRVNIGRSFDDTMFEAAISGLLGDAQRLRDALAPGLRWRARAVEP